VYVALGNVTLLAGSHADAPGVALQRLATYVALTLLLIAPWLLYVQAYEGLSEYFTSALAFTAAEGRRTATGPLPWIFFALLAIPITAIVASLKSGPHVTRAQLASAAIMLLSLDLVFLRDVLSTRIPDVIAPTAIVAAAVVGHLTHARAMQRLALLAVAVAVIAAVPQIAVKRPAIPVPMDPVRRLGEIAERLRVLSPEIMPNPSLAPVVTYLAQCTAPAERILVAGFGPEIPALAHRPFAARLPTWIPGYYEDEADVSRALAKLRDESIGAAVFLDGTTVVGRSWPPLLQVIRDRGFDEYAVASVNPRLRVWLPHQVAAMHRDASTDLPCRSR
jgi:hypothetical protein